MKYNELILNLKRIFGVSAESLNEDSNVEDITNFLGSIEAANTAVETSEAFQGLETKISDLVTQMGSFTTQLDDVVKDSITEENFNTSVANLETTVSDKLVVEIKKIKTHFGKEFNTLKTEILDIEQSADDNTDGVNSTDKSPEDNTDTFDISSMVDEELVSEFFK